MADRIFYDVQSLNPNAKVIAGSFLPNGSSAIANTSNTGQGFTVAYTSTGKYTITLTDKFNSLLSGQLTLAMTAVSGNSLEWGAIDVSSAKTLVINNVTHTHVTAVTAGTAGDAVTNNAGTLESTGGQDLTSAVATVANADIASNAANRIHFVLVLSNTNVVT